MIAGYLSDLFGTGSQSGAIAQPQNVSLENPAIDLNDPDTWDSLYGGIRTKAGIKVSHSKSLSLGAVYQAVSIISGDVACAQLNVVKFDEDGIPTIAKGHNAQRYVSDQANEYESAFEMWRRCLVHALLWGNGYLYIDREFGDRTGKVMGLYNLLPDRTGIDLRPGTDAGFVYVTEVIDQSTTPRLVEFRPDEVLHVRGISIDRTGVDLTAAAREQWGLALAASGFLSQFFAKGGHSGGVLEIPSSMSPRSASNLEEGWKRRESSDNWFRVAILRDGAKFHSTTIDPHASEMHETRDDQVYEVARFFNLPPSKLGLRETVSYNSQEQDQRQYVTGTLNHWFRTIQSECKIKLLSDRQRRTQSHAFRHDTTQLIEPDIETLTNVLGNQISSTIISPNEARARLNMPPREGGDEYGNPNTSSGAETIEQAPAAPEETVEPATEEVTDQVLDAYRILLQDSVKRASESITKYVKSLSKKPARLDKWLKDQTISRERFRMTLKPALDVCAEREIAVIDDLENKYFAKLISHINHAINEAEASTWEVLPEAIGEQCEQFLNQISDWELIR